MCCGNLRTQKCPSLNSRRCSASVLGCAAHWPPGQLFHRQQADGDVLFLVLFLLLPAPHQSFPWLMCFYIWQNFCLSDWDTSEQSPMAVKPFFITSMKNTMQKNVIVKSGPSRSHQITFRLRSIKQRSKIHHCSDNFFFFHHSPAFPWASSKLARFSRGSRSTWLSFAKKGAKSCLPSECFCCRAFPVGGGCRPASRTERAASLLPGALNVPSPVPARHEPLFTAAAARFSSLLFQCSTPPWPNWDLGN